MNVHPGRDWRFREEDLKEGRRILARSVAKETVAPNVASDRS